MKSKLTKYKRIIYGLAPCLLLALLAVGWGSVTTGYAQDFTVSCNEETQLAEFKDAIQDANASDGLDTIVLALNCDYTFTEADAGSAAEIGATALPYVTDDLIIEGNMSALVRSSSAPPFRLLHATEEASLTIHNLEIRRGKSEKSGGAIYKEGDLTLDNVYLYNNTAELSGGGVYASGRVTVTNSYLHTNVASTGHGGGLRADGGAVVRDTLIRTNEAQIGGGVYTTGPADISDSEFEWNEAHGTGGGGLYVGNSLDLQRTLFSENSTLGFGGGLWLNNSGLAKDDPSFLINNVWDENEADDGRGTEMYLRTTGNGVMTASHNTVIGQNAEGGSGIYVLGRAAVENSIISGHAIGYKRGSGVTASRHNFYWDNVVNHEGLNVAPVEDVTADPLFAETTLYRLTEDSPARNTASDVGVTEDFSGLERPSPFDTLPDRGAHEYISESLTFEVPCDADGVGSPAALRKAVKQADAAQQPDTIHIVGTNCLFEFIHPNDFLDFNALPVIHDTLIIEGNGAVLRRTAGSDDFRLIGSRAPLTLQDLTITGGQVTKQAEDGGGIRAIEPLTLTQVLVTGNYAGTDGGGVAAYEGATITGTIFRQNRSDREGGALLVLDRHLTLRESRFLENEAPRGGALYTHNLSGASQVINNVWEHNRATKENGGTIILHGHPIEAAELDLAHNTIVGLIDGKDTAVIITGAYSADGARAFNNLIAHYDTGIEFHHPAATVSLTDKNLYFDVTQPEDGVNTPGELLAGDPSFVDPGAGDYRLSFGSPAIDNAVVMNVLVDHDGVVRPQGNAPDVGAYEFTGAGSPASYQIFLPFITREEH